jgi:hypothetical protein
MWKRTGRTFAKWLHRVPENARHLAEADALLLMGISQEEADDTKEEAEVAELLYTAGWGRLGRQRT